VTVLNDDFHVHGAHCTPTWRCICLLVPTPPPTIYPTVDGERFEQKPEQEIGVCSKPITSLEECTRAAGVLGIAGGPALNDWVTDNSRPSHCYWAESLGGLVFNVEGTNGGNCSKDFVCICKQP